jgi:UDP-N-acetylglucosamine acyltransferase
MISSKADIHPDARIGENVTIGAFTAISGDVVIGDNTTIMSNATILDGARIGKNCTIFPGAVISAIPQDLKFAGEKTTAEIGDHTTIREYVTVNRGTVDRHKTVVGSNCLLMAYVHIAHDAVVGNGCILANAATVAGHVIIEDFVVIEGVVAIQQFIRIGKYAFIAGGSLVRKNVPPFVKAAREPLTYSGINSIGMRRRGMDDASIAAVEDVYRMLYVQNSNLSNALVLAEKDLPESEEKKYILDFISASEKGVIRGPGSN